MTVDTSAGSGGPSGPARATDGTHIVGLDRLSAFSDGVYAIAITLLVLELGVPSERADLLAALVEQWQEFLGYLVSFAFIGANWLTHARMTRLMTSSDTVVAGLNLLVLLLVAVLPFTTSLMVENLSGPAVGTAVAIYGINVLAASVALSSLLLYLGRERSLVVDGAADDILNSMVRARWIVIAVNLAALALAFAVPLIAVALYLLMTFLILLGPLARLRRSIR